MTSISYAASLADKTHSNAKALLCATGSPLWQQQLRKLLSEISTAVSDDQDTQPRCVGTFSVDPARLYVSSVHLVDLMDPAALTLEAGFYADKLVATFVLGERIDATFSFLENLSRIQSQIKQKIPVLIFVGMSMNSKSCQKLEQLCDRLELEHEQHVAADLGNAAILAKLVEFIRVFFVSSVVNSPPELIAEHLQADISTSASTGGEIEMANINDTLSELMKLDGAIAAILVDANSGMVLGSAGGGLNLEAAAAGNTEVVRAKLKTMKALGLNDRIEDILITLGKQYHIIRPLASRNGLFIYLAIDREKGNLGMARLKATDVEKSLEI